MKYYSLTNILKKKCIYNIIFGERSNGKTYAVLKRGIQRYLEHGYQLAVIRRYREDFRGKRGSVMFDSLVNNGNGVNEIFELTKGKYDGIHYYAGRWYLSKYDKELDKNITAPEPFAVSFALTEMEHEKSTSYPNVRTILFDEMLTRAAYLPNEFLLFTNMLSTIIRQRGPEDGIEIFMLGNTVNKYCPYFSEMGLKHVPKMQPGDIDVYKYGDSGLTVAVEYCQSTAKTGGKKSDTFFAFDNANLKMITHGSWELGMYPHNTVEYTGKDVKLYYFIEWENELLQCEIVLKDNNTFTFIHRKTTDLKDTDRDIIFSKEYHQQMNYFRNIAKPTNKIQKKIWWYFVSDNVYYQDNEIGELVRNYIQWCKTDILT